MALQIMTVEQMLANAKRLREKELQKPVPNRGRLCAINTNIAFFASLLKRKKAEKGAR